jgi:hypothetical protein
LKTFYAQFEQLEKLRIRCMLQLTQGAQVGSGMLSQNADPYIAAVCTAGGSVDAINAVFQNLRC